MSRARSRVLGNRRAASPEQPGTAQRVGLRTRWNRVFVQVAGSLVVGALIAGTATYVVDRRYHDTATRLGNEAALIAQTRRDIVTHSVNAETVKTANQQTQETSLDATIRAELVRESQQSYSGPGRALIGQALAGWVTYVQSLPNVTTSTPLSVLVIAGQATSTKVPQLLGLLDEAGAASTTAARAELRAIAGVQWVAIAAWIAFFVIAAALMVRLARRLSHEVLGPLVQLRSSANQFATGDLGHRVQLDRDDEVGDLASSFNTMADAIAGVQRTLTHEANHDSLTGLANRTAFHSRVEAVLSRRPAADTSQALLFVDLDDFKDINDTLGHAAGDELLEIVAMRLRDVVRTGDLVARLGGDEFALLLDALPSPADAMRLAERAVKSLAEPVAIHGREVHVGASIGLAMREPDSCLDSLLRQADIAMYSAKGRGKNRVEAYDSTLHDVAVDHQALKADVARAAAQGELVLDYQPILDLETAALVGVEALVRWQHPTRGLLLPALFIGLAEDSGAIIGIGTWVLKTAVEHTVTWQRQVDRPDLWVSVNVSVRQVESPDFAELVADILDTSGLDPRSLVVEVTESVLASPTGGAAEQLEKLRELGVRVALDDFGSGHSSIRYLRQLPVDILKIDRSFVSGPDAADAGAPLLEAIVNLGQRLGLVVIPEGIEQSEDLLTVQALGCTIGQGFLLARPVSPHQIAQRLLSPTPAVPHPAPGAAPAPRDHRLPGAHTAAPSRSARTPSTRTG